MIYNISQYIYKRKIFILLWPTIQRAMFDYLFPFDYNEIFCFASYTHIRLNSHSLRKDKDVLLKKKKKGER